MTQDEAGASNADQRRYWNEKGGPTWVANEEMYDQELEPLGHIAMDRAKVTLGEQVLDVGCGMGHTSLELAERVGTDGLVMAVDIAAPMIERAQQRARHAGLENIRFQLADAQTFAFQAAQFDLLFSRFGVMFFDDPVAAFRNLLRALRSGGRLAFVCWRGVEDNEWVSVLFEALSRHVEVERPLTNGPGPFGFADDRRVRSILERAGFIDVAMERVDERLLFGGTGTLDQVVPNIMQLTVVTRALDRAGVAASPEITASIRAAVAPFETAQGIRLGSASWVVTARHP